jgi:hypothetical protein
VRATNRSMKHDLLDKLNRHELTSEEAKNAAEVLTEADHQGQPGYRPSSDGMTARERLFSVANTFAAAERGGAK